MANYDKGVYRCKVLAQGFGKSKNKGTQFFFLTVQPLALVVSETEEELVYENYTRDVVKYLTDKTIDYVLDDLESIGWSGGQLSELAGNQFFVGKEILCLCEHESANDGKVYDRFNLYREMVGRSVDPLDASDVRKLDAMFGSKVKEKFRGKSKPAPVRQTVPDDAPEPEPDLPF